MKLQPTVIDDLSPGFDNVVDENANVWIALVSS